MAQPSRLHDRKCFYKYMSAKTAKIILGTNALRWSSPALFNDPFDLQFDLHMEYDRARLVSRVVQRIVDLYTGRTPAAHGNRFDGNVKLLRLFVPSLTVDEIKKENRPAIEQALKAAEDRLPKTHDELRAAIAHLKILCFSEVSDNILMWAHYAENHSGSVIEFSYIEKYASAWGAAKPVQYAADMPLLADEEKLFRSLTGQETIATPEHFQNAVYVKSADWSYEKEWRVVGGWEKDKQTEDIPFKLEEVTGVYLGCRMTEADRNEITKTLRTKYPHAAIYVGRKASRRFGLEFTKAG